MPEQLKDHVAAYRNIIGPSFLILIVLFGFFIRMYKLTQRPGALYIDEVSIGYNAYSIITTGRDEHGVSFPLFFKAFGEYKLPVYIYLVAISELLLGPTDFAVRLPSVILGTLTILLMYFLVRELLYNVPNRTIARLTPYLSSFLLAISAWHFQFSRPGFEANAALMFEVLGLTLFFLAARKSSALWLLLSLLSFTLTLYSYTSSRLVIPVIVFVLFILYFKKFTFIQWVKVITVSFLVALPVINFAFGPEGWKRAEDISIFIFVKQNLAQEMIKNYLKDISPTYLFFKGDGLFTLPKQGLLYPFEIPLLLISLIPLIKYWRREFLVCLILLAFGFIPTALTLQNPHSLRSLLALPGFIVISSLGWGGVTSLFKNRTYQVVILCVVLGGLLFSFGNFLRAYYQEINQNSFWWSWQVAQKQILKRVLEVENNNITVKFDDFEHGVHQMVALWYLKYPTDLYQKIVGKNIVGKFEFNVSPEMLKSPNVGNTLYVSSREIAGAQMLESFTRPDRTVTYHLWQF